MLAMGHQVLAVCITRAALHSWGQKNCSDNFKCGLQSAEGCMQLEAFALCIDPPSMSLSRPGLQHFGSCLHSCVSYPLPPPNPLQSLPPRRTVPKGQNV